MELTNAYIAKIKALNERYRILAEGEWKESFKDFADAAFNAVEDYGEADIWDTSTGKVIHVKEGEGEW